MTGPLQVEVDTDYHHGGMVRLSTDYGDPVWLTPDEARQAAAALPAQLLEAAAAAERIPPRAPGPPSEVDRMMSRTVTARLLTMADSRFVAEALLQPRPTDGDVVTYETVSFEVPASHAVSIEVDTPSRSVDT